LNIESTAPVSSVRAEEVAGEDRHGGKPFSLFTIRLSAKRAAWRNAVALSWGRGEQEAVGVRLSAQGDILQFPAGSRGAVLDWRTGVANRLPTDAAPSAGVSPGRSPGQNR